jgi:transposase
MKRVTFKRSTTSDYELFPPCLDEQIKPNSHECIVSRLIDSLDTGWLEKGYAGGGTSAYNPKALLKAVIFAYMNNIYSCRDIESQIRYDNRYRWLCGGLTPSYSTINRFRSERLREKIGLVFVSLVKELVKAGVVSVEQVYVDGSTMEARSSRTSLVWRKSIERYQHDNEEKLSRLLLQIDGSIEQDRLGVQDVGAMSSEELDSIAATLQEKLDAMGTNCPGRAKISEALRRTGKQKGYISQLEKLNGRNSYSKTDESATAMHPKEDICHKGWCRAMYNMQIGTNDQYVLGFGLFPNPTDVRTFTKFMETLHQVCGEGMDEVIADAGYGSEENYRYLWEHGLIGYLKYAGYARKQDATYVTSPYSTDNFPYDGTTDTCQCPAGKQMRHTGTCHKTTDSGIDVQTEVFRADGCSGCPMREKCRVPDGKDKEINISLRWRGIKKEVDQLLDSERGRDLLHRRALEPEPVFGQTKYDYRYKRFRHFDKCKILMDLTLFFIAFDILKFIRTASPAMLKRFVDAGIKLLRKFLDVSINCNGIKLRLVTISQFFLLLNLNIKFKHYSIRYNF